MVAYSVGRVESCPSTPQQVGVLGGGQLGKMLAVAAARMGIRLKVLDPTENCPAAAVAEHVQGSFNDADSIRAFVEGADVLTVEIEHINAAAVAEAREQRGVDAEPTPETLAIIQDKHAQKRHFERQGVAVVEYLEVADDAGAERAAATLGLPFMLKAKRLAFDGRGNQAVRRREDLPAAVQALGGYQHGLYAERWVEFTRELAVMVARSRDGSVLSFPVTETVHRDSICWVTQTPAAVPEALRREAQRTAEKAVACLEGAGVFGVEMFATRGGGLLLNEVAPRPHNSGHYTIEGCAVSQFEQHLRAVLGLPLGDPSLKVGSSIMLNVLGAADGAAGEVAARELLDRAYATPGATVHWYGKKGFARNRKIGHITLVADTAAEARRRLAAIDPAADQALQRSADAFEDDARQRQQPAASCDGAEVAIIMGSDSDLPTMRAAAQVLRDFGVRCRVTVVSAHRTPERMLDFARAAHTQGVKVIIAGAGGAAHLPGMVAALTPLPVIGVPVTPAGAHLDGLDALMSIVQMPRGVPVATVAIGNAANAGLLAVRILAGYNPALLDKMLAYQEGMRTTVLAKAERLEREGWEQY